MNRVLRILTLPTLALATALTLVACGGSGSDAGGHDTGTIQSSTTTSAPTGAPAAGARNDADVTFATNMIPHHAQAITMAEMALTHATNAEVKTLATAIKAAQDPEIQAMSGWLKGWGKPVPTTTAGPGMSGMGGMGGTMPGMMSDQEMTGLNKASGPAFETMWLEMMIRHHEGAVTMAKTELTSGGNAEAKKLAQAIIDGQTKEIAQMKTLLRTLAG